MLSMMSVCQSVALASGGNGDGEEPVCYLCLDLGSDEFDQPLRRDCECRGTDAGFAHFFSCLIGYAAAKRIRLMIWTNLEICG